MDVLTQLKAAWWWFIATVLIISFVANYKLFNDTVNLKAQNQTLEDKVVMQEEANQNLANQIQSLMENRKREQQATDEAMSRELLAHNQLRERVSQLEKELSDENCANEPIGYSDNWVSGY